MLYSCTFFSKHFLNFKILVSLDQCIRCIGTSDLSKSRYLTLNKIGRKGNSSENGSDTHVQVVKGFDGMGWSFPCHCMLWYAWHTIRRPTKASQETGGRDVYQEDFPRHTTAVRNRGTQITAAYCTLTWVNSQWMASNAGWNSAQQQGLRQREAYGVVACF